MPDEILIADDGSTAETTALVDSYREKFAIPIKHVWQPDKGFRLAKIRNKAIAASSGDYIVQIDGDIVMSPSFIADHARFAKPGIFCVGSRGKLNEEATAALVASGKAPRVHPLMPGLRRRLNVLRIPLLSPLFFGRNHGRGCNVGFWKKDAIDINGYDERMIGAGLEDTDFEERLKRNGVNKRFLKLSATGCHLHHKAPKASDINEALLIENRAKGTIRAQKGIDSVDS